MKHSDGDSHENYSSHETTRIEPPIDVSRSRSAVVAFAPSFDFDESPLSSVIETNHENDSWRDRLEGEHYTNIVIDDDVEAGPTPSDVPSGSGDFDNPVRRKGNRRESMVRDLSTGRMGGGRAQSAQVRTSLVEERLY